MGFYLFMLAMGLLIPLAMVIIGRAYRKAAPKSINFICGYRTARSMKNEDTWRFAHQVCGRLWFRWGIILLPLSLLVMLSVLGQDEAAIGMAGFYLCLAQLVPLLGVIPFTERALRRAFDRDGRRIPRQTEEE